MDLNFLLHRHQVSLMRAYSATSNEARCVHHKLAVGYAVRIAELRDEMGASSAMVLRT